MSAPLLIDSYFQNRHTRRHVFLIARQTEKLIHIRNACSTALQSEYIYIFNSIYDTQYTMRLDNSCMSRHIAALTFNPFYFFFPFIWHNIYWRTESRAVRALENFRPLRHRWGLSLTALYGAIETERRIGLVGRGGIWLVRWAATHSREITPPHIDKDQAKAAIWHTGQLSGPYHGIYSAFAV